MGVFTSLQFYNIWVMNSAHLHWNLGNKICFQYSWVKRNSYFLTKVIDASGSFRDRGQFTLLHTQFYFNELLTSVLISLIPCTETLAFQKLILYLLIKWSVVIATFLIKRSGTFSKDLLLFMDSPRDDTCWKHTFKFVDLLLCILFVFFYFSTRS